MKASDNLSPAIVELAPEMLYIPKARDGAFLKMLFEHLHATLKSCMRHPDTLERYIPLVEAIVFGFDGPGVMEELRASEAQLRDFNDAYCVWETALERVFTESVRNDRPVDMSRYALNERFNRLLRREVRMLTGPFHKKRALFIGSGPVPISAIWMNRLLGTSVDCLDGNGTATELSRRLIDALGLSSQIRVMQGTGESFDVSGYDIILIALLAKPKKLILRNIYRTAPEGCQVICRTSYGLRQLLYEPTHFDDDLMQHFSREDERVVVGNYDDTISSVLLRKVI